VHVWANLGEEKLRPSIVEACRGRQLVSIAGGFGRSAVLLRDGAPCSTSGDDLSALDGIDGRLAQLAFGKEHVLALTEEGEVYTMGSGGWGQLGHASMRASAVALPVGKLSGRRVVAVCAGAMHSAALTDGGEVYTWGRGFEGQLGHGEGCNEATLSPRCVVGLAPAGRVRAVSAGALHCAALAHDGAVWTWGEGTSGQLGMGALVSKAAQPLRVDGLPPCVAVSCGYMHTAAAAGAAGAYAWGLGTHGQLGYDARTPNARFATAPVRVEGALAAAQVSLVVCAGNTTSALDADGRAYSWGERVTEPTELLGAELGRVSMLAADGRATVGFVETSLGRVVPGCALRAGGTPIELYGWGLYTASESSARDQEGSARVSESSAALIRLVEQASGTQQIVPAEVVLDSRDGQPPRRTVRALLPALHSAGDAELTVSLDGGASYTARPLSLRVLEQPSALRLEPPLLTLGAATGLLVLADAPLAASADARARVRCGSFEIILPARHDPTSGGYRVETAGLEAALLDATLELALDGVTFAEAAACAFSLHAPPVATRVEPTVGPLGGGTAVRLHVAQFVQTERARVRLVELRGAHVGAQPPAADAAADGEAAPAADASAPAAAPPGDRGAPAEAEAAAAGEAAEAAPLEVTIDAKMARAPSGAGGVLTFVLPADALGGAPARFAIELALNGADFESTAREFVAHAPLAVEALVPSFGLPSGGVRVRVRGGPFFESGEARALVHSGAARLVAPARFDEASGELEFEAPAWDVGAHGDAPIVEVALNGADWTTWCVHFRYSQWLLSALEPANGPAGTTVKLRGTGLAESAEIAVRFEVATAEPAAPLVHTVPGTFSDDGTVVCVAPAFEGQPGALARVTLALNGVQFEQSSAREFKYDEVKGGAKKK
jgi:hypothetical protein